VTLSSMFSYSTRKQIVKLISTGKRLDGRDLTDFRNIQIDKGLIQKAEGSAKIHLGKTEVLTGVKIEVGRPFPDLPNMGVLTVNAELVPLASPTFESGPPREGAIELARIVDRGIRESKVIDLEALCLIPGKKVFVVFVDIYVLNHAGNLIDSSAMASLAALLNTKLPNYEVENDEIKLKSGHTQLKIMNYPVSVTFGKIGDKLLIDPIFDEENIMDARLTVTFDKDEKICAIQKGGNGSFTTQEILKAVNVAKEKIENIRKIIVDS
jgi:exosome complex component RRP42